MSFFCKHDFEVIDKEHIESAYEQMTKKRAITRFNFASSDMFSKATIWCLKCKKCNKVKFHREDNPQ